MSLAWLLLVPMLSACQPQVRSADSDAPPPSPSPTRVTVLEIESAVQQPHGDSPASGSEASACQAWSLDAQQAESFFDLSTPLAEGDLHDFAWLPCTISGRLQAEGREWAFQINAAGTSTWRAGDETRLLGCAHSACEPFVILMPEIVRD